MDIQPHYEGAAFAGCADHIQVAFVLFDNLFCDRQSQTEPLEELVAAFILGVETLEDMGKDSRLDADTLVTDFHANLVALPVQADFNLASLRAEFDGII